MICGQVRVDRSKSAHTIENIESWTIYTTPPETSLLPNLCALSRHIKKFTIQHGLKRAKATIALSPPFIFETVSNKSTSTPTPSEFGNLPLNNLAWDYSYLAPTPSTVGHQFYVWGMARHTILQCHILSKLANTNLKHITTTTTALLKAYRHLAGVGTLPTELAASILNKEAWERYISANDLQKHRPNPGDSELETNDEIITATILGASLIKN